MFYETEYPFSHLFGDEIGAFVAGELEQLNVKLVPKTKFDHKTKYDIDLFINAAGAVPDTDFLTNSKLIKRQDNFIVTSEHFQTGHNDVYAVGDVSLANGTNNQHWAYAQESGKLAARHIMDEADYAMKQVLKIDRTNAKLQTSSDYGMVGIWRFKVAHAISWKILDRKGHSSQVLIKW